MKKTLTRVTPNQKLNLLSQRRSEIRQIVLSNSVLWNLSPSLFQKFDKTNLWNFLVEFPSPWKGRQVGVLANFLGLACLMIILQIIDSMRMSVALLRCMPFEVVDLFRIWA